MLSQHSHHMTEGKTVSQHRSPESPSLATIFLHNRETNCPRTIRLPILPGWLADSINIFSTVGLWSTLSFCYKICWTSGLARSDGGCQNHHTLRSAGLWLRESVYSKHSTKFQKGGPSCQEAPSGWRSPFSFAIPVKNPWRRPCCEVMSALAGRASKVMSALAGRASEVMSALAGRARSHGLYETRCAKLINCTIS